ncbi:heat shock protein 70-like protein [Ophiostoma piceae UAMH 11346]|uniref:Heat shock protein 70-like protein n=1 Tax=Ophiostoma piceae (strain UAMH 11346) TaxID=1262450 RepID=S3C0R7_OPHP1|nr:heat shock protein 70-like protein [Ophiostoma piceae UAMH 11346]
MVRLSLPTLAGVLLCASHALAASAVLGVDLGTEFIKASLVKPGIPLEIVLTKDSRRKETSAVAFKPPSNGAPVADAWPERAYGSDAMAIAARFPGDVYPNLKTLLGLTVTDNSVVQEYADRHPALKLEAHADRDTAAFKSSGAFVDSEDAWMVEELLAMELKSVRRNAELLAGSDTSVRSVVITVPPFYTIDEKRAVELAANLAGLRVLSLISDGLAVGLNYATSRQFPSVSELTKKEKKDKVERKKPEVHLVFDMGAGSTKATIMRFQSRSVKDIGKFNKTVQEVEVLGSGWDRTLGGDTLNYLIVDDMIDKFVASAAAKKAGVDADKVKAHGRTVAKLSKEAERVRHVLSANSNTAASFEGLYDDIDFRYKISRADFEAMAEVHAERVGVAVQSALKKAGLTVADLDSVILHGGATRTPFVQKQLEKALGGAEKLRTNVNSDESAVFGAGFRAAELSPSFRVKEIRVSEGAVYGVTVKASSSSDKGVFAIADKQLWTPTSHLNKASEELVFQIPADGAKSEESLIFSQQIPGVDGAVVEAATKTLKTANLTATIDKLVDKHACDASAITVKLGLRLSNENGEVEVTKLVAGCESSTPEKEGIMGGVKNIFGFGKKDQQPIKEGEESSSTTSTVSGEESSTSTTSSSSSTSTKAPAPTKASVSIPVKYTLEKQGVAQLTDDQLSKIKKRLQAFDTSDRGRLAREEIFNRLEGLTYKVRSRLEDDAFVAASTAQERATLDAMIDDVSDWLYSAEGSSSSHEQIKKKLLALETPANAIEARIAEAEKRPELVAIIKETIKSSEEFAKNIRGKITEYEEFKLAEAAKAEAAAAATDATDAGADAAPAAESVEFDGLEDDEADAPVPVEERGPAPPLYTQEDVAESETLVESISKWLEEAEAAQNKLAPHEDPVLTIKDLQAKTEQLNRAGSDLAMKAVRGLERKKAEKAEKAEKARKAQAAKAKKAKAAKAKAAAEAEAEVEAEVEAEAESTSTSTAAASEATVAEEVKHEEL